MINAMTDSLAGTRVVKSFANEELERRKFRATNDAFLDSKSRMYGAMANYQAMSALLSGVLYTVIIVLGGYLGELGVELAAEGLDGRGVRQVRIWLPWPFRRAARRRRRR